MKLKYFFHFITATAIATGIYSCTDEDLAPQAENLTQYVDPYIGTGDHGHVFLGANVPFGFVQLGPTQPTQGWDWCSGYHYSDSVIVGFSHLHLSGTGIGDLGDITFFPTVDDTRIHTFEHSDETVKPGYYAVSIKKPGIDVELTATQRCGFHRYKFPQGKKQMIVIDLERGIGWDAPTEGYLVQENDTVVSGYRVSKGWADYQQVYFTAVFSEPIKEFTVGDNNQNFQAGKTTKGKTAFANLLFDTDNPVEVRVALSPVSIENAKLNLQAELPSWNFEQTVIAADKAWNKELSKAVVKTDNLKNKRVYYTALYHSMIAPSVFGDVNGDYRGSDRNVYKNAGFTNYTTFSLWDTYRAAHPLATIIHSTESADYGKTMLNIYRQQGKLPVWHLMGNETDCMVGNPGVAVMADLFLKGLIADEDKEAAYEAMKTSAMLDERSLGLLKEYGYIPFDKEPTNETVAKGMEYALADWGIAQVAKQLNKEEDYQYFITRSQSYKNYFDKETRFMRALSTDRKFRLPFNPFHAEHRVNDYTEGNAWQYTWLVPHDVYGLVDLFESEEAFTSKLDSLFTVEGDLGENASPDVSGLIGQYAHGNEPSHHVVYMYPYVGQQWKTAEKVREILTTLYFDAPAGLCGNEDVGQMSSWYILSSWGFYQVAPAGGVYVFGSPLFDEVNLNVANNKTFTIIAHNNSDENIYIQSVSLNGKPYTKTYITYEDIMSGGKLEFTMGNTPSEFGSSKEDRPL